MEGAETVSADRATTEVNVAAPRLHNTFTASVGFLRFKLPNAIIAFEAFKLAHYYVLQADWS